MIKKLKVKMQKSKLQFKSQKLTEKESWSTKKLGEVCDFEGGTQPPKSVFKYEPQKGYVRLLQIRDFVSDEKATYVPDLPKLRKCTADDVLIGRYGASVGKILRGKAGAYNVAIIKTIPNEKLLLKDYLYTFLQSPSVQGRFVGFAKRAAQAGFTKEEVGSIKIPLPLLEEQKRIVKKIEKLFAKIDEASRLRAESSVAATALLPSALHQVFSRAGKEKWEEKELGDVCEELFAGGDVPKDSKKEKDDIYKIPIYSNGIGEKSLYGFAKKARVNRKCVTISARGTIGYPEIRKEPFYPAIRLVVAVPKPGVIDVRFLKYVLETIEVQGTGNTIPQLTVPMIKSKKIPLPHIAKQKKIVAYLDSLSGKTRELQNLQSQTAADFSALRQSILAKAFKGSVN
jgi:type I restriction enzyme S subunit